MQFIILLNKSPFLFIPLQQCEFLEKHSIILNLCWLLGKTMLEKWLYMIRSYLGFTRREMRGFVFVVPILALLYATPYFIEKYNRTASQALYLEYIAKNKAFFASESTFTNIFQEEKQSKKSGKESEQEGDNNSSQQLKKPTKPSFNKQILLFILSLE